MVLSPAVHTIGCCMLSFLPYRSTALILPRSELANLAEPLFFLSFLSFKSILTVVGPVELWATRERRPSAAANPQGFLAPLSRIAVLRTIADTLVSPWAQRQGPAARSGVPLHIGTCMPRGGPPITHRTSGPELRPGDRSGLVRTVHGSLPSEIRSVPAGRAVRLTFHRCKLRYNKSKAPAEDTPCPFPAHLSAAQRSPAVSCPGI